jgi:hypothetical protein
MIRYLYVMAHSFSGSTLASFLLGAHPEIATVGEPGIAPGIDSEGFSCSCGKPILECAFWRRVTEGMNRRGLDFDIRRSGLRFRVENDSIADRLLRAGPQTPLLELARSAAIRIWPRAHYERQRLLHRYENFVAVVTETQGRGAFVDISKRPGGLIHLLEAPSFRLRAVRLVRDPRAVAYSCVKNLGMSIEDGARSWANFQSESARMMRLLSPDSCATVRYEDLCADTGGVLARLHRLVGVTPVTDIPDYRATEHHIIGNRMRLESGSRVQLDERWRRALSASQVEVVNRITGWARTELGYVTD